MFDESAFDQDDIGSAAPSPSMSAVSAVPSLFYGTSSPSSSLCPSPTTYAPTAHSSALASPGIPCISLPPTSSSSSNKSASDEIKFTRKPSSQNAPLPTTFATATPYQSRRRSYPVIRQSQFSGGNGVASTSKPSHPPAEQINITGTVDQHAQASAIDSLRRHTNPNTSPMSMSMSQTPLSSFLNGWFGSSPTHATSADKNQNRARSQSHSHSQTLYSNGRVSHPQEDTDGQRGRGSRWFGEDYDDEQPEDGERRGRAATRSRSRDTDVSAYRRSPRASRNSRKANASRSKSSVRVLTPLKQEQSDDTILGDGVDGISGVVDDGISDGLSNKLTISTQNHNLNHNGDQDNFDLEATPKLEKKQVVSLLD
ncbi:hypothetical protein E3P99_02604 [Wallemia hederae]|uniref:Uncharacterized protein n=1 Tax=Wallemia hederae TaxID=1540922 RepID=A0A4T0FJI6_9BASI|nr:hypothetical protein E3P99_02604 [Wallemia hederae]